MHPETTFLRACYGQPHSHTPVWLMRQAGRYQQSYRQLKEKVGFWGICTQPDLIREVTLRAALELNTDAAIIFSDITLPAWAMGLDLEFSPGPQFAKPVRTRQDIENLQLYDPNDKTQFLLEGIRKTRSDLPREKSLIGFIGAPLTLAAYMIEGKPQRQWKHFKTLAYNDPQTLSAFLDKLSDTLIAHAKAQIEAGCDCIQLFDTALAELAPPHLMQFGFEYARKVITQLKSEKVPIIYFARNVAQHLEHLKHLGATVLGVDWTISIRQVRKVIGDDITLMGNLDPLMLYCEKTALEKRIREILQEAEGLPGYIFNLGHGVLPESPPENVRFLVETVHRLSKAT